ncbi:hypothetical protein [Streptomyces sp. WMMC1477]|uniref:hypothetical protein n=1 Tax=Streptomyces sp. WMMC1477 TaxID=3015155 RepID=UPI0022B601F8|nr:hypothetical protein [Streptomyces sp. WMMC1477]MCZ7433192.1 hypothetical protein [Streptomyces sp. WMMC1477]
MTAFREAREGRAQAAPVAGGGALGTSVPDIGRRALRRTGRPLRAGFAVALAGCALGGVAVAATTGALTAPFDTPTQEPGRSATAPPLVSEDDGSAPGERDSHDHRGPAGGAPPTDTTGDPEASRPGAGGEDAVEGRGDDTGSYWSFDRLLPTLPRTEQDRALMVHLCRAYERELIQLAERRQLAEAAGGSEYISRFCGSRGDGDGENGDGDHGDADEDGSGSPDAGGELPTDPSFPTGGDGGDGGLEGGDEVPGGGLEGGDEVPGGGLEGGDEVPGGGLEGGDEVPGGGLEGGDEVPGDGLEGGDEVPDPPPGPPQGPNPGPPHGPGAHGPGDPTPGNPTPGGPGAGGGSGDGDGGPGNAPGNPQPNPDNPNPGTPGSPTPGTPGNPGGPGPGAHSDKGGTGDGRKPGSGSGGNPGAVSGPGAGVVPVIPAQPGATSPEASATEDRSDVARTPA